MGMTDINNAAAAQNALTARINAFLDTIDADIATRQAAYAALSADLVGIVSDQMYFVAYVDPDEANPTNERGGSFTTIKAAVDAAPYGAYVWVSLEAGKSHHVSSGIDTRSKNIVLAGNSGNRPTIVFESYVAGNLNYVHAFKASTGAAVFLNHVDVALQPKADGALSWGIAQAPFQHAVGHAWDIGWNSGTFTGDDSRALIRADGGMNINLRMNAVTLDGPIYAIGASGSANSLIATQAVTLANGAALHSGNTTLGVNLLTNQ